MSIGLHCDGAIRPWTPTPRAMFDWSFIGN